LGTTTIAASLIDLDSGKLCGSAGIRNPQSRFGDDIISRICSQKKFPNILNELQKDIISACNELIIRICHKNKISASNIFSAAMAGNTAMECFSCGITAEHLGEIPFAPPFKKSLILNASNDLNLQINPSAPVYVFPIIGGFVGGDIVAGISACRLDEHKKPALFIDIGTNGEIVAALDGKLYAASAAAGPAFEGAGIESGMMASPGAIEKVIISDGDVNINVIKNIPPIGICGSAIIDIVAEMLEWGILEENGRIRSPEEIPGRCGKKIKERLFSEDNGNTWDFLISRPKVGKKIFIRQKDVREIQLACGAIRAATTILLKKISIDYQMLDVIFVAGGFGNFIRRNKAKRIGLLPDVPDHKIRYVGNTSLEGAREAIISTDRMKKAEELAEKTEYVEISLDSEFQIFFADAMIFPSALTT
jgi:uncharacterized 2Fe-2S/4Fe-4S cluster protein (DUF4445 family)